MVNMKQYFINKLDKILSDSNKALYEILDIEPNLSEIIWEEVIKPNFYLIIKNKGEVMKEFNNTPKKKYVEKCKRYEELINNLLEELRQANYSKSRIKYWALKAQDITLPL